VDVDMTVSFPDVIYHVGMSAETASDGTAKSAVDYMYVQLGDDDIADARRVRITDLRSVEKTSAMLDEMGISNCAKDPYRNYEHTIILVCFTRLDPSFFDVKAITALRALCDPDIVRNVRSQARRMHMRTVATNP
jgi:hypothetical protein